MQEFQPKHGSLERVHAVVAAVRGVTPTAQPFRALRPFFTPGNNNTRFSAGAEILGRIETKAGRIAETASPPPFVLGSMGLGRVCVSSDNRDPAPPARMTAFM